LTFLNDPELIEGEFRNDNALLNSLFEPCTNSTEKARGKNRRAAHYEKHKIYHQSRL